MAPLIAAAPAIAGMAIWVRAPGLCGPTKLRFEVDTLRWPGGTLSPLEAMHIEQPGSRHSKPASRNTLSSPSASASRFTLSEPGTIQAVTGAALWRPLAAAAAARRSELRHVVPETDDTPPDPWGLRRLGRPRPPAAPRRPPLRRAA